MKDNFTICKVTKRQDIERICQYNCIRFGMFICLEIFINSFLAMLDSISVESLNCLYLYIPEWLNNYYFL